MVNNVSKRLVSLVLSLALVISSLPIIAWADTVFAGNGTQSDPYLIQSADDLRLLSEKAGGDAAYAEAHYRLTGDIDLKSVEFTPIGSDSRAFAGTLDGDGHVIKNLNINLPGGNAVGLVGKLSGTVKNLGVESGTVIGGKWTAGIAGRGWGGTVINCFNKAAVKGTDTGGIIGQMNSGSIINCYNLGDISGTESVGGLAGYAGSLNIPSIPTNILNSYSASAVSGKYTGAVVGYADPKQPPAAMTAYYDRDIFSVGIGQNADAAPDGAAVGKTTAELKAPEMADTLNAGLADGYDAWKSNTDANKGYPSLENVYATLIPGTEELPYLIENEEDLFRMAQDVDADEAYASAYYRLTADITLTRDFTPIGKVNPFTGTLDGKGFVIRDLNINAPTEKKVGLFAQIKGTVKDLGIESGMIAGKQYVGAIAGYAMEATVYNCYNKAAVTGGDAGGLIGQMNSSALYNSYNLGSVGAGTETTVGGLAGYAGSYNNHEVPTVIENCYSAGIVKAGEFGGAAVGYNDDLYPTEMKSVFYDSTLTAIGIGNSIGASSVQGKSTEEMQSFAVAAALNLGKTGAAWNSWIRGESGYPEFGTDDSTAELQDFLNLHLNVSPAVDENGYLVMPESENGRFTMELFGSDNEQVVTPEGKVYTPLVDTDVYLIYKIVDRMNPSVKSIADKNTIFHIEGSEIPVENANACPNVIPGLREWAGGIGNFVLGADAKLLIADESARAGAEMVQMFFKDMLGRELAIAVGEEPAAGDVLLVFDESLLPELGDEGYYLDIGDVITITAPTKIGLQYGGTTITQILYQDDAMRNVPKGKVRDYPAYEVRSQQLEVGRRYMDLGYVEEMAKYMAWFKMSELHMHINENGGEYSASFIVESKLYPEINRNNKDYMWTQDEYRQFQKNVKEFGIDVVTEIDTPGHSTVFGYVRPDLVNGASFDLNKFDEVYEFVCSLFDEFLDGEDPVFQSSVFHIGTDESSNSAENMRKYIDAMTKYCMSKDNIDEVRFWANLSLYRGQTPVTTDATMQIWDARDQYADEALEWGYDLVNSTSSKMYIVPGNGPNWVNFTDWKDPVWLYENWKSVSDFDTYGIPEGHAYYGKYNILRGHPQIKGAEGCIWNDTANGFSDRDIFDRAKDYNVVIAEKAWYGDTNRFASGEDFVKAYTPLDTKVPGGNPNRYVDSKGDTIAKYDFESTTVEGLATDLSGNGYDAVINNAQITEKVRGTDAENQALRLDGEGSFDLPFDGVGYPFTLEMDLWLDADQTENAVLFTGRDGTVTLDIDGNGNLGFTRGKYTYKFDYKVPTEKWVHLMLTCKADHYPSRDETFLFIDNEFVDAAKYLNGSMPFSTTMILPTGHIAQNVRGYIDNLTISNQYLNVDFDFLLEGEGTEASPYLIHNAEELLHMSSALSFLPVYADKVYRLENHIDLEGYAWKPIGSSYGFTGVFDGNGYTISNIQVKGGQYVGLFAKVTDGTVKNLGIESGRIEGDKYVGGIAGYTLRATILNCYNKADIFGADVGGLIGQMNSSTAANCYNLGTVTLTGSITCGGIAGYAGSASDESVRTILQNCYNGGTVIGGNGTGSIVGYVENPETHPTYASVYISNYYDPAKNGKGLGNLEVSEGITAKTTEEMQSAAFADLLNETLSEGGWRWTAENDYPAFADMKPVVEPLVVTGAPESGYTRSFVTLKAEKEATWTVNGEEVGWTASSLQFRDEGTYTVVARAGDAVSETIVFTIDRTAPVLAASVEHYGITNQDVHFNANEEVTFYNGSNVIGEGTELTLTESGVYNIRAIDKAGNYTAFYRVTIMKDAPVLTGAPEGVTRANVAIRSNVKVIFIVNGVEADDYAYGLKITEEGKYTVKAVDMAGNETEVSFEIDRTKPAFTASVPSGQPTGQDITLTANEPVDFVIDGVTVATGTEYTVSQSGLTYISIYDLAGNYGGVYKANIDKSAPVLSAVIEGTNKAVENGSTVKQNVTVKASEASYFIINDGDQTARANFVKLKASGTYTVKAVDMLGNVSEVFTVTIKK